MSDDSDDECFSYKNSNSRGLPAFGRIAEKDEPMPRLRKIFDQDFMKRQSNPSSRDEDLLGYKFDPSSRTSIDLQTIFPYTHDFVTNLLFNKHVVLIGDSLTRAIYKDLVCMLQKDDLLDIRTLKMKSESSCLDDRLVDTLELDADKVFRQAREYCTDYYLVQYLFTTRVIKDDVEKLLLQCESTGEYPDVVVINSALWDLTRYYDNDTNMRDFDPYQENPISQLQDETEAMEEYLERIAILMRRLHVILPAHTQVIWLLMPWPLPEGDSSLFTRIGGQRKLHRSIYLDGNYRAAQIVSSAGYDVLDIGFYLRNHALYPLRVHDGVHWSIVGTRLMTQLLIGHLAKNLTELPPEINEKLEKCIEKCNDLASDEHLSHTYFTETAQNIRTENEEEINEPYFNKLHRDLAEQTYDKIPRDIRTSIDQDIQFCRLISLMKAMDLKLDEDDEEQLEDEALQMPNIKTHLPDGDCQPQNIKRI